MLLERAFEAPIGNEPHQRDENENAAGHPGTIKGHGDAERIEDR
jgi:hypothetical protein